MENQTTPHWIRESVIVKLLLIALIALALLIPSAWIQDLITERSARQEEVMNDVSNKWSGSQLIQGPVLVIPYKIKFSVKDTSNHVMIKESVRNLYLMPENLKIKANIKSKNKHRGIFEVGVYNTGINITGNFDRADIAKLQIDTASLMLDRARLVFGLSDLKGLKSNPAIKVAKQTVGVEPILNGELLDNGLQAAINLSTVNGNSIPFSFNLSLKGSQSLNFVPTGKTTEVAVNGNWPSPKFDGRYLPDTSTITPKGFDAHWRMLYYNRPFPIRC
jgi:inner membrane protein